MNRKQTIDRALMSLDIVLDYLDSGGHKSDAVASVLDAQRQIKQLDFEAYWDGYEQGEAAGRSQIKARHDDDERLDAAMSEARTSIGTFFDDLRAIYQPKEGSGPTHG